MKRLVLTALVALILGFSTLAHADPLPLQDNGNNLIYDPNLNITWYDPVPTAMTWDQAMGWAASLTVGGTTAGSWSLPTTLPVNGSAYNYNYSNDGFTDRGYNISAPNSAYPGSTGSEMAYLYYVDLGNKALLDVNGNPQAGYGLVNKGPFANLVSTDYWSGTEYPAEYGPQPGLAWAFGFSVGSQGWEGSPDYALAVTPGDVGAPTPIPGAIFFFAPGLAGIVALRRRIGTIARKADGPLIVLLESSPIDSQAAG